VVFYLKHGDFRVVYQIDGASQRIIGMKDIKINTQDDELVLQNARYVPRARSKKPHLTWELHDNVMSTMLTGTS
jgi:hypothetical protein